MLIKYKDKPESRPILYVGLVLLLLGNFIGPYTKGVLQVLLYSLAAIGVICFFIYVGMNWKALNQKITKK